MIFVRSSEAIWAIGILAGLEPEYLELETKGGIAMWSDYEISARVTNEDGVVFHCYLKPNLRYGEQGGEWIFSGPRGIMEAAAGDETAISVLMGSWRRFLSVIQDYTGASESWWISKLQEMDDALKFSISEEALNQ